MTRRLAPRSLFADVPFAYAVVTEPGVRLLWLAGVCPLDPDGNVVAPGDPVGQASRVVSNLRSVLAEAGSGIEDIVKTTVFVVATDHDELVRTWEAVRREIGPPDPPSTLLGVSSLGYTGQHLEVEAVAECRST